jgi:hypothetical protein
MTEKIDIIGKVIYRYNQDQEQQEFIPLAGEHDSLVNEFSDTEELFSINVSDPVKRIMKFYDIEDGVPGNMTELNYSDMTAPQKVILDDFITKVNV